MDKKENGMQAGNADTENRETMDFLTGMLDNATHCGGDSTDTAESGTAPAETDRKDDKA